MPQRAVWWPEHEMLLVADLHWGKTESFQSRGVAIPSGMLTAELERLADCAHAKDARSIVVLGDLIHDRAGITEEVVVEIAKWRQSFDLPLKLVPGNHDRHLAHLPESWKIERLEPEVRVGEVELRHHPTCGSSFGFCGHLHPTYVIRGGSDRVRCPCFHITPDYCVLPAFSEFSSGVQVPKGPRDRIVVIAESTLIEV